MCGHFWDRAAPLSPGTAHSSQHGVRDRCGMAQGCSLRASTLAALVFHAGVWVATS